MAESAVSFALGEVFQILKEETILLSGVHKDFRDIRDELESIQAFLKDADTRAADEANNNDGIRTWVKQVREASFRVQDVIDDYIRVDHVAQPLRCGASVFRITSLIKTLTSRHQIATEIQDIKLSLSVIKERSERYRFQVSQEQPLSSSSTRGNGESRWHDPRMGSLFIEETEIVGFENPRDELVGWLLKGTEERTVISVVGMGGLGKTTLAKHVFDSENVKNHFDCHACITVSQSYTVRGLFIDMIKQFCKEIEVTLPEKLHEMDERSLISELRQYMEHKRYLIFFDDVWQENFCDQVEAALPKNSKSSRIIITTRMMNVAEFFKKSFPVHVHHLQLLPPNKAWELFCKKAFRFERDGQCPEELEAMSNEMVRKCKGLPLAIVAIGGLLSTKSKTVFEWQKVSRYLNLELLRNAHLTSLTKILSLSYDDLPYYLKPCILYFGIYPEDYSIHHNRLTKQWIAEGFVKSDGRRTLEQIADEYLSELIYRSLVQVSTVSFQGNIKSCQVHDFLHEVIIRKVKDLSFCHLVHEGDESATGGIIRRLSMDSGSNNVSMISKTAHIRAIHAFGQGGQLELFIGQLSSKSKLKVLDLEGTSLNYVPSNVGNLFHLRYINLRRTKIRVLPKSVGELHNLETLDIRDTLVQKLPSEINKLNKLRHLLAFHRNYGAEYSVMGFTTGVIIKRGIGNLTCLQNLYFVAVDHGGLDLIQEMRMLRQLRRLGLRRVRREYGNAICALVVEMTHLESLKIAAIDEDEVIDLNSISSLSQLGRLHLKARLEKMPNWISKLEFVVKMRLALCSLKDDPLRSLENLPNLLKLGMWDNAYVGETLHFQIGGFPKLKRLNIARLNRVKSIHIDKGALLCLESFKITKIPHLMELSSGIKAMDNLKVIDFRDMSTEFVGSIDPQNGKDYWIINHVPVVFIRRWIGPRFNDYEFRTIHPSSSESPTD